MEFEKRRTLLSDHTQNLRMTVTLNCLDFVIKHLKDSAPRVKWEACKNNRHCYPKISK